MAEALRHRIRAAGLLVVEQRILLVRHEVGGDIYWIPPGGGFESECDESTKDTVRREFFEETGLRVDVGPLVYVREFAEPAAGRFHMELFYRIDAWRGEPTLANLKGLGGDEFDIREVGWIARDELPGLLGSVGYRDAYPELIALLADGRLDLARAVTRSVPLEQAVEHGFEALLRDKSQVKVLVNPNPALADA